MDNTLFEIIKALRPQQWSKNISLYAALVFSGFLFNINYFLLVTLAFFIFCLLSSATYLINDIIDLPQDKKHPYKRNRPIASGKVSVFFALVLAIILFILVGITSLLLSNFFFLFCITYFLLQILYSFHLKHIPILDVLAIASGFVIRIYAGSVVVNLHMSVWFLLTVISASLFLAVSKRQSELTLLKSRGEDLKSHRETLSHYSQRLLDIYTGMFANATWITYALYSFQREEYLLESGINNQVMQIKSFIPLLPNTLYAQKWLMITVPIVIYGVMRYLQLVYESDQGESPEKIIWNDKPIRITLVLFAFSVITIIYGLN